MTDTTSSLSLRAALSYGLPAVVTGRTGSSVNGSGIEVPRRDPRALADALSRLAADPGLRARMASEARRVGASRPWRTTLRNSRRIYRETLG